MKEIIYKLTWCWTKYPKKKFEVLGTIKAVTYLEELLWADHLWTCQEIVIKIVEA